MEMFLIMFLVQETKSSTLIYVSVSYIIVQTFNYQLWFIFQLFFYFSSQVIAFHYKQRIILFQITTLFLLTGKLFHQQKNLTYCDDRPWMNTVLSISFDVKFHSAQTVTSVDTFFGCIITLFISLLLVYLFRQMSDSPHLSRCFCKYLVLFCNFPTL